MTATIKLGQLAEFLGATLRGSAEKEITGLATLQEAGPAQLSFLANPQYRKHLPACRAAAVLLTEADAGVICSNSSIPIEISKRRATEDFYNPMDMVCQNCGRCQ